MMTPPAATQQPYPSAMPDATIPSRSPKPSRFGLIFGIVATALTLGAIALAVFAPQLTSAPRLEAPHGWQQVYNGNPGDATALWNNVSGRTGCSFPSEGLDIASDGACVFTPASSVSLDGGVLIVAQVAPAADVSLAQDAGVLLDNSVIVLISQDGSYQMCIDTCDVFSPRAAGTLASGSTIAWHTDAFVPNEMAVLYDADQGTVSLYVNGQYVDHIAVATGGSPTIALMTSSTGEALFTHVAIYAGATS